jgi:hypothetical protein
MSAPILCSIDNCGNNMRARGLCDGHYQRWRKRGDEFDRSPVNRRDPHAKRSFLAEVVAKPPFDLCVEWPFKLSSTGYGQLRINGRSRSASRWACELYYGPPASASHEAAHSCHNRACLNPLHLRWATPKENSGDRVIDGTKFEGEAHPNAKLTDCQVAEIRRLYAERKLLQKEIGAMFGVRQTVISAIVRRSAWKHLP